MGSIPFFLGTGGILTPVSHSIKVVLGYSGTVPVAVKFVGGGLRMRWVGQHVRVRAPASEGGSFFRLNVSADHTGIAGMKLVLIRRRWRVAQL